MYRYKHLIEYTESDDQTICRNRSSYDNRSFFRKKMKNISSVSNQNYKNFVEKNKKLKGILLASNYNFF